MLGQLDEVCAEIGRDPATLERSVGIWVEPTGERTAEATGLGIPISGSPAEIAETIAGFREIGVTRVELMVWPGTVDSLGALEPAIGLINT